MEVDPLLVRKSGRGDEDEFRVLLGRDGEFGFVDGGDAVADRNPLPVNEDHALGRGEIGVPEPILAVRDGRAGKKSCAEDPGVGANLQRVLVLGVSARERDQASRPTGFREAAAVPARCSTALTRKQPDLEDFQWVILGIALGMAYSRSCAHHLDISRVDVSDVAGAVFMGDHALANISDNLNVRVSVVAETGVGRDLVIVPDDESAERAIRGVAPRRHDEVVARLEPAVIAAIQGFLDLSCNIFIPRARLAFVSGMIWRRVR